MDRYAWLVWSIEHCMWWGAGHRGYTPHRAEAGRYTFEEAVAIVTNANEHHFNDPYEAMVRDESKCCKAPMVNGGAQCENCGSNGL